VKFNKLGLVGTLTSEVLCDLRFSQNQPQKSPDGWYVGIIEKYNKNFVGFFFSSFNFLLYPTQISAQRIGHGSHNMFVTSKRIHNFRVRLPLQRNILDAPMNCDVLQTACHVCLWSTRKIAPLEY
jgi:hypothetical protein